MFSIENKLIYKMESLMDINLILMDMMNFIIYIQYTNISLNNLIKNMERFINVII